MAHEVANSETILGEIVLSPHARSAGKTLRELHFREKYGLNVLALWRRDKPVVEGVPEMRLQPGDALLVQGPAARFGLLRDERDFLLLEQDPDAILRPRKTRLAAGITLVTLIVAAMAWLPVPVAALAGDGAAAAHRLRLDGRRLPGDRVEGDLPDRRHVAAGHRPGQHRAGRRCRQRAAERRSSACRRSPWQRSCSSSPACSAR